MIGVSYWTKEDGEKLANDIPAIFGQQNGKQIFWDDVALIRKRKDYCVHVRPCRDEDIIEIDDFEDLQRIDPSYVVKKRANNAESGRKVEKEAKKQSEEYFEKRPSRKARSVGLCCLDWVSRM